MYPLLFLGVFSFLISFLLTPVVRNVFRALGLVDKPGDFRRIHREPIPRVGGVAIALSYALTFAAQFALNFNSRPGLGTIVPDIISFLPAAAIVFLVGLLDDIAGLKPWQKLAGQTVAAAVAFLGGVHVQAFGGHAFAPWLSLPLTIGWLIACTNALNLIDGMDGLAAGVGLFATCTTLIAALIQQNMTLALVTMPLAGCLLGFLRYNFNPATIFLGDSGSLLTGFLLGCYGVLWSNKAATILGMTAPLMALSIPLLDTSLAIARRFLRQRPIFEADRNHIHHRLLDRGLTPRRAAFVLYAFCALGATFSLMMMNRNLSGFVVILFCFVAWIGVQHLGYVEFGVARRMFVQGDFRRALNSQIAIQSFERQLSDAQTPDDCWCAIEENAKEFGFHTIEMRLAGRSYRYRNGGSPTHSWSVRIPISDQDFVELTREFGSDCQHSLIPQFAESLRKTLDPKMSTFTRPQSTSSASLR